MNKLSPKAKEFVETFRGLGIDIQVQHAVTLAESCSTVESAMDYYMSNPTVFLSATEIDLYDRFRDCGFLIEPHQAISLSKRCSTIEGAIEYYLNNPFLFNARPAIEKVENDTANQTQEGAIILDEINIFHPGNTEQRARKLSKDTKPAQPSADFSTDQSNIATEGTTFENNSDSVLNKKEALLEMGFESNSIENALSKYETLEEAAQFLSQGGEEVEIECPICTDEFQSFEMVSLSCAHSYCKTCFSGYCATKINEGRVLCTDLICCVLNPETRTYCGEPISEFVLQNHLSQELLDKYQKFSTKAFCEAARMRRCPKCNDWYVDMMAALLLDREDQWKSITCEKCNHLFCGRCGQRPHKGQADQDIDCAAFSAWLQQNEGIDQSFFEYMKEKKIFPCPKCKMAGELMSGCKFLYCRCTANFCALCGIQLKEPQHFSHFQGGTGCTGPFGEGCLGTVDTAGVDIDESQV